MDQRNAARGSRTLLSMLRHACVLLALAAVGCTSELDKQFNSLTDPADSKPQVEDGADEASTDDAVSPDAEGNMPLPSAAPTTAGSGATASDALDAGAFGDDAVYPLDGSAPAPSTLDPDAMGDGGVVVGDDAPLPGPALDAGNGSTAANLVLLESEPPSGALDVPVDVTLVLSFDRDMQANAGQIVLLEVADQLSVEVVPAMDSRVHFYHGASEAGPFRVTVDWDAPLRHDTEYAVLVEPNAIVGVDGARFEALASGTELTFTTGTPEPVELALTSPLPEAVDVARGADIVLTFNQEIVAGAVGEIALLDTRADEVVAHESVAANPRVQISGTTLSFNPSPELDYATSYVVLLDPGAVRSVEGAVFAGLDEGDPLGFTTQAAPLPVLVGSAPPAAAVSVDPEANLVLSFDMPIRAAEGTIAVFESNSGSVFEQVEIDDPRVTISDVSVTVNLDATLDNATAYYVTMTPGTVESTLGAKFAGIGDASTLSFTTAAVPPPPLQLLGTTPPHQAQQVDAGTDIVLIFSEAVSLGTGSVTVFRAADATVFESVPVDDGRIELVGDTVTIDLQATLTANTAYYVTVGAGAFISVRGAAFAGILGPGGFGFETDHPFVLISKTPADGASAVGPNTGLSLEFSAAVEAHTGELVISSGSYVVESIAITSAQVSIAGAVVTITPSTPFAHGATYSVSVEAGALGKVDGPDYPAILNADWTFSTASACDAGETRGPNGDCYFFSLGPATWEIARQACDRGTGWDLARISDEADQTFVQGLVTKDAWLGASDEAESGEWRWVNNGVQFWQGDLFGEAVAGAYENWKGDQPSGGDQHCARVLSSANDWLWADALCDDEYGFLCQGPAN